MKDRVIVTKPIIGICAMQVCAINEASDEEILEVCNRENPAGTQNGWTTVVRTDAPAGWPPINQPGPVKCANDPEHRQHIIITC